MAGPASRCLTFLRGVCICYCAAALLYTTVYVVAIPASQGFLSLFGIRNSGSSSLSLSVTPRVDLVSHARRVLEDRQRSQATSELDTSYATSWNFETERDLLYWNSRAPGAQTEGPLDEGTWNAPSMHEETYLSKAFASALHPTEFIPFYYKATGSVDPDDVTITTLVTSNRFKVFKELVERYQGPISVTIHIPLPPSNAADASSTHQFIAAIKALDALYASSPHFSTHVDVHLALTPIPDAARPPSESTEGGRQFNVWRNVARLFARTDFVMMLDVDFAVCTDWRSAVRLVLDSQSEHAMRLRNGTAAFVVPVFEYTRQEDGLDQRTFPRNKQSLVHLATGSRPKLAMFHASWAPGHNSTDYKQYLEIPPDSWQVYKVTTYQSAYEPYVIMSKRVSWCDERFTGYGANKAACLFEVYLSGVSYYVLADHFLIHQSHKYEEEARREERKYNRKLYADFKEEACLRYLYRFHTAGLLNTPIAENALEQCRRIKTVEKLASELLGVSL